MALPDDVRAACAQVAETARHVTIVQDAIADYARTLGEQPPAPDLGGGDAERRAAFSLQLNAINFGSGWFPTLRKADGRSGFRTIEAGLREHGPWTAGELQAMTTERIAEATGQESRHELMGLFARALREIGAHVAERHGGSFAAMAGAHSGAVALAEELATLPMWRDVSPYGDRLVPFYKRAQIAAADLALQGLAPKDDFARFTIFADNLVPHVLRIDGVLRADPDLVARIDAGELLEHDSPEEVELRACAVHAVELLVAAHGATTAADVDNVLWHRGADRRYKDHPRHRARTTAY
jgi:Potential Queuosine, Q, salvage protein family